jgi:riboflavin transporter FmnP
MQHRPLSNIAHDIKRDWKNVNFGALPYLAAMLQMDKVTDQYMYDSGKSIVLYFLSNATTWRGPVAKEIKAELKALTK